MSSGKQVRPRKLLKGGTTSTRKHRFQSFNQRISKLNIDPIRRSRRNPVEADDLTASASFLRASLDRWKDLNLSENFTSFVQEIEPICNSLAQILHYNQRIFDILEYYIEKRDSLSLEPLLDLLGNFAHDLGIRFEGHFLKAVALVASLAAKHADVEAIEWSFTCLAWLFKYLSRLLVPNLRPLFDIMAPLLGREPQKIHTTRFAAEAMSFLIRKAANMYINDTKPLTIIVNATRDDILQVYECRVKESNVRLYQQGLMTLLVNSIKGIDRKLHSGGAHIYRCMLDCHFADDNDQDTVFKEIVYGITVALIHQTDSDNFQPILDIVLGQLKGLTTGSSKASVAVGGRLLFVISTVRKGSRIQDWTPVLDAMLALLELCDPSDEAAVVETYKASAVILQYSPLALVLTKVRQAMKIIADDRFAPFFLPFCNYFFDLGQDRFQDFLGTQLSRFIASNWKDHELELCLAVPKLGQASNCKNFPCPTPLQEQIVKTFEDAVNKEDHVVRCYGYLQLLDFVTVSPGTTNKIMGSLSDMVHQNLQLSSSSSLRKTFSLGRGLKAYVQFTPSLGARFSESWPFMCSQAADYGSLPPFLEAILLLVKANRLPDYNNESLARVLIENLHSSSHTLRSLSLRILDALYTKNNAEKADIIATALTIEDSPRDLQSARTISMHARRLSSQYEASSSDEWLKKAIPHFCFGMLTFKLSQVWDDAIAALKQICETKVGEHVVSALAFKWLQEHALEHEIGNLSTLPPKAQGPLTDFQCSNLIQVEQLIEHETLEIATAAEKSRRQFFATHTLSPQHPPNKPSLALRVLIAVPHVAEKQSRQLVPIFLSWATKELDQGPEALAENAEAQAPANASENLNSSRLKRKDHKAMLDLFGCFHNPKVLYRSSDVFLALQSLLTNGDAEVQKSALKALLTWKPQGVQPYQQNLLNLLDDARFRDEISTFVHLDTQSSVIQEDHLPELMPVMLRLLYGRMIAGSSASSVSRGQSGRRKTVLEALSRLDEIYLQEFVIIALDRLRDIRPVKGTQVNEELFRTEIISTRKQLGVVKMMKDMLEILGDRVAPFAKSLAQALLYCMIRASRKLRLEKGATDQGLEGVGQVSFSKAIRQVGLQCLTLLFRCCQAESLKPYLSTIFSELLSPRLDALPVETAQSVSGTLQLFSTWALSKSTVLFLVDYDARAMKSVIDCLDVSSAKDRVKMFVIEEILGNIVSLATLSVTEGLEMNSSSGSHSKSIAQEVLHPNTDNMLDRMGSLLRKSPSKELLNAAIQLISALAPLVQGSSQVDNLLEICIFLLDQPSYRVNPRSKGELLQIIQHFVPLIGSALSSGLQHRIFRTASSLFGYFKDRANRLILSKVLSVLAEQDSELQDVARLCTSLNSFSPKKIDEPDFDERLKAFNAINEIRYREFTPKQWRPILSNMLFYVKDNEELAIRSNASFALRRFVETNIVTSDAAETESSNLTRTILLPALRNGVSEPSELVRIEYLGVTAHLIRHNPEWQEVSDMSVLLVNNDEEASFFGNVLHIQQHRRLRALRRLAIEARQGGLRSVNVAHFFIPLIEHFVFDKAEDESAHNLSTETVMTIGALASSLEWPQFRAMFRRFSGYIQSKPDVEKTVIKLLGVVIDALSLAAEEKERVLTTFNEPGTDKLEPSVSVHTRSTLAVTMPRQEKLADDLTNNLLPSLEKYLHDKDESTVSLRVPVAVSVVKLLKLLPHDGLKFRLPPVLTDVCHILRSRAQESRDLTRKTLVEISTLIGPQYFGFVVKELRSALARGYQLHVLSFTVHSILVATSPIFKPGDLDYCLPQIISVVMDDIFGATGQEKDAEEYISKMKEVKSSKSYDSLELVAKTATVENFVHLVRPLQALLGEKVDLRMVKKIDELLRRIGAGLLRNEAVQDRRVLVFCHEIITEVYKTGRTPGGSQSKVDHRNKRFLINYKGANKTGSRGSTSSYEYKLARFSLDVLRMVLHKYDVLQTPSNLAGFIPIIGDGIVQSSEEVQVSTLRLLTTIIKVPLKTIDDNAAIYVAECVKIIKASTTTNVELPQAALKLVSAILRERRTIEIRETDLAYLLTRLIPDLEEPDKQGVSFSFLKAIMSRKIVITEVYEVLDAVAIIMVTNQTRGARDMARGAYFQFIMDYPQSRDRFTKQLGFLVRNLDYKHQEGRQSVMEAIHLLFTKVGEELVQDIIGTFFVPLVMVIVNDESNECREMAGMLLKKSFERADAERSQSFLSLLRAWLGQSEETLLIRVAFQMYSLYLDTNGPQGEKEVSLLQARLAQILKSNLKAPLEADWGLLYFALQTFAKICQLFSASTFGASIAPLWASVRRCLFFPHAWVKLLAAKLLGTYFADFARKNTGNEALSLPLKGSGGLWLSEQEMIEVTRASLGLLRVPGVSEELASQSVRNLVFLGKIMAQTSMLWQQKDQQPEAETNEDEQSEDENDPEEEELSTSTTKPALGYLIQRASSLLRRGALTTRSPSLISLHASLTLLGALTNNVPLPILNPHIPTLLIPLHNLTDPAIPTPFSTDTAFTDGYKTLVSNSQELMALLQKKLGTTEYVTILQEVREGVKNRREGRRAKRRIEAVAEPERGGERKRRKGIRKKERRKERGGEERGRRMGW
ncbi:MAG: U3 snoRNP protein [Alectoria fallacina]|uniref:U3 snoRNP protein n=1 Tax=Alectoria fallacina TaxID=1903189 RepID=A0A8H3FNE4_9LECA|nr:MAG: U3 snoRNP protein [Alectoria fallacina]